MRMTRIGRKIEYFNSHAHVERDKILPPYSLSSDHFNSHAHVERDMIDLIINRKFKHFNSHAHVERDISMTPFTPSTKISTHTLTWSVT